MLMIPQISMGFPPAAGGVLPTQSIEFNGSNNALYMSSANFDFADRNLWWIAVSINRGDLNAGDLISKWGGGGNRSFVLSFNISNQIEFAASDSSNNVLASFTTSTTFASTGVFYNLFLVYDKAGGTLNLYNNGSEVSYGSRTQPNSGGATVHNGTADVGWAYPNVVDWLNCLVYQGTFGQGTKPTLGDIYDGTELKSLVGVAGVTSLLDVAGGNVGSDAIKAVDWTLQGTPTASSTIP